MNSSWRDLGVHRATVEITGDGDGFVGIPDEMLEAVGLKVDDEVEVWVIGPQLVIRKKGALRDGAQAPDSK